MDLFSLKMAEFYLRAKWHMHVHYSFLVILHSFWFISIFVTKLIARKEVNIFLFIQYFHRLEIPNICVRQWSLIAMISEYDDREN